MEAAGNCTKRKVTIGKVAVKVATMMVMAWYHWKGNCVSLTFLHASRALAFGLPTLWRGALAMTIKGDKKNTKEANTLKKKLIRTAVEDVRNNARELTTVTTT